MGRSFLSIGRQECPSRTTRASGKQAAFLAPSIAANGCPLSDDRVALKLQVKEANDIVDVVGSYITLRPVGPTFKGLCPFHDDHRPSFDVDPRRQRYRCWACGKFGDVFNFVQEYERVGFPEALELLARRAGISLDSLKKSQHGPSRAHMFDVVRWAAERFRECLLDDPAAESARIYLGERKLAGETVRRFGLGFAPPAGEWLVQKAAQAKMPFDLLETVGLVAKRTEGTGYYDRFRDRVIFPIRDMRGHTVGFGGRVLPSSPSAAKAPKYYNSAETPLFSKSDQLYGIDQARQAALKAGYLAIVEGYTDVMMAHQHGVPQVAATMGTAFNARHLRKIRGVVERVVLVFDADAGGEGGVDRALEVFVSHDMDLRIATLPAGLDPCDLIAEQGPAPFELALARADDVFEFKLARVWQEAQAGVESQRKAIEQMLSVLAAAPEERSVKMELMINRIAHRLGLKEETLWSKLKELRGKRRSNGAPLPARRSAADAAPASAFQVGVQVEQAASAPAARQEIELLEVLLADGALVAKAIGQVSPEDIEHPGLCELLKGLYRLHAEGLQPDLDHLRARLDNERLLDKAQQLQERGLIHADKLAWLGELLARFEERRATRRTDEIKNEVLAAEDHAQALEVLKRLQKKEGEP